MPPKSADYRRNAEDAMRRAMAALGQAERSDHLRAAAAWARLAKGAEEFARKYGEVIPFVEPPDNPLEDEGEV